MIVDLKNKFISVGGSSFVVDENGNKIYTIKGKVFSFTRVKRIYDMQGNLLFKVRNKWFNFFVHHAYIYAANGVKIARVKDKFFNVHRQYFVTGLEDDIQLSGGFFSLTCTILRNGQAIGTLSRNIAFRDSFRIEADEADMPFLIALCVAVDNITDNKRDD